MPNRIKRENDIRAAELPLGQHKAVDRAKDGGNDRGRDHHVEAVPQIRRQFFKGFCKVIEVDARGQIPHGLQADFIKAFKAGDQHDVQRDQVKDRHEDERDVQQVAPLEADVDRTLL